MTGPQDPFATPGDDDPSQPSQGTPPPYGQSPYGQPPYGQQPYGQQPYGSPPYRQAQGTNGMAIAALVTSLLCSPLGILLGFIAKGQIKKTGQSGNGLATAGIVIGVVSMLLGVLLFAGGFSATGPGTGGL